jgi:hypothetical protein
MIEINDGIPSGRNIQRFWLSRRIIRIPELGANREPCLSNRFIVVENKQRWRRGRY